MRAFSRSARRRSGIRFAFATGTLTGAFWLAGFTAFAEPAAKWRTTEIGGRAYVALPDVAAAHGLTFAVEREDEKEIGARGTDQSLIVRLGSRQALIDGVRHWLSFETRPDDGGVPHLSLVDVETVLQPALDPGSIEDLPPTRTIVFDPGHGGHDRGAKSPLGVEKDYALDTVNRARRILEERGFEVVQSRLSDFFAPLRDRPAMTKNYEDPIFVSVHYNAAPWRPAAAGLEIFAMPPHGAPSTGSDPNEDKDTVDFAGDDHVGASFLLANTIHRTLLGRIEGYDRGVKKARFLVLREAEVPAVLVEGGFLSNPAEAKKVHSPEWREHFATALADGIEAYVRFTTEGMVPEAFRDLGRAPTDDFVPEE